MADEMSTVAVISASTNTCTASATGAMVWAVESAISESMCSSVVSTSM